MNPQFKKGVLEMLVLLIVSNKDIYGYELVQKVNKITSVNEGTIYPLLKRLTNEKYFETYLVESNEGPPRKYYQITTIGLKRSAELVKEWDGFSKSVNEFINQREVTYE